MSILRTRPDGKHEGRQHNIVLNPIQTMEKTGNLSTSTYNPPGSGKTGTHYSWGTKRISYTLTPYPFMRRNLMCQNSLGKTVRWFLLVKEVRETLSTFIKSNKKGEWSSYFG